MHDDFNRHETYVLAQRESDGLVLSIVYVAADVSLDIVEHADRATALCYLLETAEHTFRPLDTENFESDTLASFATLLLERQTKQR